MIRFFIQIFIFSIIAFSFASNAYSAKLEIGSITIKETPSNQIMIEWKSTLSKAVFMLFHSSSTPISNLTALKNATNIFKSELTGISTNGRYIFNSYLDKPVYQRNNYYAIMQVSSNWKDSDLKANENYNINPFVFSNVAATTNQTGEQANIDPQDETNQFGIDMKLLLAPAAAVPVEIPVIPVGPGDFFVTNLILKTNCASILLFWDIAGGKIPDSIQFDIYRTTNVLTGSELSFVIPVATLIDEYNYEDPNVLYGMPYYYTVVPKGNNVIHPGWNQNTNAIFIGMTNQTFVVEREILSKTNLKPESFRQRFKNK